MPSTTTPPTPQDTAYLAALKDYWLPVVTGIGGLLSGWLGQLLTAHNGSEQMLTERLKVLMAGYEARIQDLKDELGKVRNEVIELRKALDLRPPCESCSTRARLESELEEARQMQDHIQHMSLQRKEP